MVKPVTGLNKGSPNDRRAGALLLRAGARRRKGGLTANEPANPATFSPFRAKEG